MKKLILGVIAIMAMAGCSDKNNVSGINTENAADTNTAANTDVKKTEDSSDMPIQIKDIDWEVEQAIIDGKRIFAVKYTNNSNYNISYLNIEFTQKDGVKQEEINKVFDGDNFKNNLNKDHFKQIKYVINSEYRAGDYISGTNRKKVLKPNESEKTELYFFQNNLLTVKEDYEYEIVRPNIMTIKYINNNNEYTLYYDFKNDKLDAGEVYELSKTELRDYGLLEHLKIRDLIPPELNFGNISSEENNRIVINNCTEEQVKEYAEKCKSMNGWILTNEENTEGESYSGFHYYFKTSDTDDNYTLSISFETYKDGRKPRCFISLSD